MIPRNHLDKLWFTFSEEVIIKFQYFFLRKGLLHGMGKLTWESAHAWILKILCNLIVWGII